MPKPNTPNTLFELKENEEVRLDGLTFIKVTSIGSPALKATISAQMLKGDERCIYNHNGDDWQELDTLDHIIVGVGDKLIIGNVQIMMTTLSKRYKTIRLSLRSNDQQTSQSIRKAVGK